MPLVEKIEKSTAEPGATVAVRLTVRDGLTLGLRRLALRWEIVAAQRAGRWNRHQMIGDRGWPA